jgi:hypothetical protein
MVEMNAEELGRPQDASGGAEPQERASGTGEVQGAATREQPAVGLEGLLSELKALREEKQVGQGEEFWRAVQSEADRRDAIRRKGKTEPRSASTPSPSVPSMEEIYAQQLQSMGVPPQQIPSYIQQTRSQYGAYQSQQQLAEMQSQMAAMTKMQTVQRRCAEEGVDPSDPDLDIGDDSTPDSFERSLMKAKERRITKQWEQRVADIEAKLKQVQAETQAKLQEAGVYDTLVGKERVARTGDVVAQMERLSAEFRAGNITTEAYQRGMAELERQS